MSNYQLQPQTAPPKYSASKPAIFDGTDSSISFLDFIQVLQVSPDWTGVNPSMAHNNMEDILPAHLYGPALRYYESLHPVFLGDWERLRDVMTFRFPGPLRSGGLVWRSATRWDEDGLRTIADAPPRWATPLMSSGSKPIQTETSVRNSPKRKHFASALKITEKLRLPSINRSPSPSHTSFHGAQVTVHALYIESDYGGRIWSPPHPTALEAKVNLNDQQAVLAAKKDPLITILASHAKGYRIGFLYSVNYGEHEINFWHNILAPKEYFGN
ncbi:hypothetical protein FRC00_002370 [Tulasnella sp. 408]|nr:hypothetical protein FRC00_002370 [Tulasnella sp. 408]